MSNELQYDGMPVDVVRVELTVSFEAFALHNDDSHELLQKILASVADAVEYRAPWGTDTEEGDALIATTTEPEVSGRFEVISSDGFTSEKVKDAAEGLSASL